MRCERPCTGGLCAGRWLTTRATRPGTAERCLRAWRAYRIRILDKMNLTANADLTYHVIGNGLIE
jgi:hypothetical protein